MNDLPDESRPFYLPAVLFMLAAVALVVSLFLLWVPDGRGWEIVILSPYYCVTELWESLRTGHLRRQWISILLLTLANVSLLATVLFGWRVHRRHSMPMLLLASYGVVSGLISPVIFRPEAKSIFYWQGYADLHVGFWLWTVSLAFVAGAWGSLVWEHRRAKHQVATHGPPE